MAHPTYQAALLEINYHSDSGDESSDDEVFPLTDNPVTNPFDSAFIEVSYRNSVPREVRTGFELQANLVNASMPVRFAPVAMTCTNMSFAKQHIDITMFYNWERPGSALVTDVTITFNIGNYNVTRTIAASRPKVEPLVSGSLIFSDHHKTIRHTDLHWDFHPQGVWNVDATSTFTMDLDMVLGIVNMPRKVIRLAVAMATVTRLGKSSGLFVLDPGLLRMICDLICGPCVHARAVVPFVVTVADHGNQEPEIEVAGESVLGPRLHQIQALADVQD